MSTDRTREPFPFRFRIAPLPSQDCSQWRRLPTLKGISCMSEEELSRTWAGGATCQETLGITTSTQYLITTNFGGHPDHMPDTDQPPVGDL